MEFKRRRKRPLKHFYMFLLESHRYNHLLRRPQKIDIISHLIYFSLSKLGDLVVFLWSSQNIWTLPYLNVWWPNLYVVVPGFLFFKVFSTKVDGRNSLTKRSPSLKLGYGLAVGNQTFSSLTFSYPFVCPSHLQFQAEFLKIKTNF